VLLLENLRFHAEEKKGDLAFAQQLADLGCDVYVNDAFGTAHRAHASTTTIASLFLPTARFSGLLLDAEIKNANRVLKEAEAPFIAIIGGAKISDKISLLDQLLEKVQYLLIGGGMAYTFIHAMGGQIGQSMFEEDKTDLAGQLLAKAKDKGVELLLPTDHVIADKFAADAQTKVMSSHQTPDSWMGLDIGPETCAQFQAVIAQSKTILWNGPMGVFEFEAFQSGTQSVAKAVAKATKAGAFSLVGGGDSVSAIKKFNLEDQISYISTGGGAMLEFFEGKELPGVKALAL